MRRLAPALVLFAACGDASSSRGGTTSAAPFSREAYAPRVADAGANEPPVPSAPDPAALAEIIAAAPKGSARAPTAIDGGTAIGKDTGVREDAGADAGEDAGAEPRKTAKVIVGKVQSPPPLADPATEQALRAQVYHRLTLRCRAPDQRILPPEVVHVYFLVDTDGYLVGSSILASTKDDRYAEAARCMARELAMITFRAPPAARGRPFEIDADIPSVD